MKMLIFRCCRSWFKFTIVVVPYLSVSEEKSCHILHQKILVCILLNRQILQIIIIMELKWKINPINFTMSRSRSSVSFEKLSVFFKFTSDKFEICLCNFVSRFLCARLPLEVHVQALSYLKNIRIYVYIYIYKTEQRVLPWILPFSLAARNAKERCSCVVSFRPSFWLPVV